MSYKIQIFTLEIELHKIYEQKNAAIKLMKYEVAGAFRELEKVKSKEIFDLVDELKRRFEEIEISSYNFNELKELSNFIYYYQNEGNPSLAKKIEAAIKNLELQKEEALLVQNFKLREEFNKEIDFLSTNNVK